MKNNASKPSEPHVTLGSVLDDLDFTPTEALELKVKADIYRELMSYILERKLGQSDLVSLLGIHQPDASNLLNGRVSKFSIAKLIRFAGKLDLRATITLIRPDSEEKRTVSVAA